MRAQTAGEQVLAQLPRPAVSGQSPVCLCDLQVDGGNQSTCKDQSERESILLNKNAFIELINISNAKIVKREKMRFREIKEIVRLTCSP